MAFSLTSWEFGLIYKKLQRAPFISKVKHIYPLSQPFALRCFSSKTFRTLHSPTSKATLMSCFIVAWLSFPSTTGLLQMAFDYDAISQRPWNIVMGTFEEKPSNLSTLQGLKMCYTFQTQHCS